MDRAMERLYRVGLDEPLVTQSIGTLLVEGDHEANRITVQIMDNGVEADLNGCAGSGYFRRADGDMVVLQPEVNGNELTVLLPQACYATSGQCQIILRLVDNGNKMVRTVLYLNGRVQQQGDGSLIDPGERIPTLDELIAQIAIMEEATKMAQTAAKEASDVAYTVQTKLDSGEFTGKGLQILGYYDTADALMASAKNPATGDAYGVGTAEPYAIYVWDGLHSVWVNNGEIQGPQGERGPQGEIGQRGPTGVSAVNNLLDNSDFSNPINQRGKTTYTGTGYTIDRWRTWGSAHSVDVSVGCAVVSGAIQQYVEHADANEVHTFAACDAAGNIYLVSGQPSAAPEIPKLFMGVGSNGYTHVGLRDGMWHWAVLYKGAYTLENLPERVSKGRAAELAECQRYFWKCDNTYFAEGAGYAFDATTFRASIVLPQEMRTTPTMAADNGDTTHYGIKVCANSGTTTSPTAVSMQMKRNRACLTLTGAYKAGETGVLRLESALSFSADL